jgi:Flp pilus assembly protein TadD
MNDHRLSRPFDWVKIIGLAVFTFVVIVFCVAATYLLLPVYSKPVAQYLLAQATESYNANHYSQALADLGEATRLDPQNTTALNNYAWVLATCPDATVRDGKKALAIALKACELSKWNDAAAWDTLAAAYAETGDFDNAIKWENKYLSSLSLTQADATDGQARFGLYEAHQPYHSDQ